MVGCVNSLKQNKSSWCGRHFSRQGASTVIKYHKNIDSRMRDEGFLHTLLPHLADLRAVFSLFLLPYQNTLTKSNLREGGCILGYNSSLSKGSHSWRVLKAAGYIISHLLWGAKRRIYAPLLAWYQLVLPITKIRPQLNQGRLEWLTIKTCPQRHVQASTRSKFYF